MLPIVSALKHHRTTVVLVALEIALTCAIVTNALFLIRDRLAFMHMTTGVADGELVWVQTHALDLGQDDAKGSRTGVIAADLAALRGLPGVESVAMANALPLGRSYSSTVVYRRPGDKSSALHDVVEYLGSPGMARTLGITLAAGRDFLPREYADYRIFGHGQSPPTAAIVTRSFAQQMWPGEDPLGKPIYLDEHGDHATRVVGVVGQLLNPAINKYQGIDRGMILPVRQVTDNSKYVLRVRPEARANVPRAIPAALQRVDPARTIAAHVYTDTIARYFEGDRAMVWLLVVVVGCLLALAALGVVGLSSFWVQQRTRTIGIRRAIGATRRDILGYFLAENFLIVGLGVAVGSVGAVSLNLWLMDRYELHHMPLSWLPVGAMVLWLLGQLAVLGPALRAAAVPPVVATRSV
jgi:putative ABC transport system permease protein